MRASKELFFTPLYMDSIIIRTQFRDGYLFNPRAILQDQE